MAVICENPWQQSNDWLARRTEPASERIILALTEEGGNEDGVTLCRTFSKPCFTVILGFFFLKIWFSDKVIECEVCSVFRGHQNIVSLQKIQQYT